MLGTGVVLLLAAGAGGERWTGQGLPLPAGTIELRVGGAALLVDDGNRPPSQPALAASATLTDLSLRFGLTPRLELDGLALRFTAVDSSAGAPGLIVEGGLKGLGISSVEGVIVAPAVGVELFGRGETWVGLLAAELRSRVSTNGPFAFSDATLSLRGLHRLSDRLSAGASVGGGLAWLDLAGDRRLGVDVFASLRLRLHLTDAWAVDGVVDAHATHFSTGVSLVWAPSGLWHTDGPAQWW